MTVRRVVAEIGSCQGDLHLAIDTAQAAIDAGAWMVKGQGYTADMLVTRTAPGYGHATISEPATQYEAFTDALTADEWAKVADAVGGRFFLSVFDESWCVDYPYDYIKIASADITYRGLIEAAVATEAHLILSTGAATLEEVNRAMKWVDAKPTRTRVQPTLLVCTLSYPCDLADAQVGRVEKLRVSWPDTGYSDHTGGISAASVAFERGAVLVEKHFTITPGEGGDHDFAIGPAELRWLVDATYAVEPGVWRTVYGSARFGDIQDSELAARGLARRSICARVGIPAGTRIDRDMLSMLRPGGGLEPWVVDELIGQPSPQSYLAGEPL